MTRKLKNPKASTRQPTARPHRTKDSPLGMLGAAFSAAILTAEEETDLLKRWLEAGDPAAMRRLVESHGRLVVKIALNYIKLGLPLEDLVQEGLSGLVQAIHRFDPSQGCRLSTYARWSIRAAIQAFILRNWSSVRLTKAEQEAFFARHARARQRAMTATTANSNRNPRTSASDAAAQSPVGWCVRARDLSLNMPAFEDDGKERQDLLSDDRPSPEDAVIDALDRQIWHRRLEAALEVLSARERTIIKERHLREDGLGLKELGEHFGVSKERVRQVEKRALEKLSRSLKRKRPANDKMTAQRTA